MSFANTPFAYTSGFNANGIVVTPNGKYLIIAQTNARRLFRVAIATRKVAPIALGGQRVNGDGLALLGHTLYAVSGDRIAKIRLAADFSRGTVVSRTGDPSFDTPTTLALAGRRLLVVNSQFARRGKKSRLPFTVSSIPTP